MDVVDWFGSWLVDHARYCGQTAKATNDEITITIVLKLGFPVYSSPDKPIKRQ